MNRKNNQTFFLVWLGLMVMGSVFYGGCSKGTEQIIDTEISTVASSESAVSGSTESTTGLNTDSENLSDGTVNLYLVRHGKTIMNTLDLVQGWSDSPLTAAGVEVAENAALGLAEIKFDYAFSSDRGRAIETAEIILAANDLSKDTPLVTMEGLREANFGGFEGQPNAYMWEQIANYHGVEDINAVVDKVGSENVFADVPDLDPTQTAEDHEQVIARLVQSFDDIVAEVSANGGGNVLVVGHGASLLTSIGALTNESGLPAGLGNASVSKIVYKDGTYKVEYVNNLEFAEVGEAIRAKNEKPVRVYLVKSGRTDFNEVGRIEGWIDSPLAPAGLEQISQLGKELEEIKFSSVYISGMGRSVETAKLILEQNLKNSDLVVEKNPALRAANFGEYEGRMFTDLLADAVTYYGVSTVSELTTDSISQLERLLFFINKKDSTAENIYDVSARVGLALDTIVKNGAANQEENILVIIDESSISALMMRLGVKETGDSDLIIMTYQNGVLNIENS